jgi:hypothetical protein
VAVKVMCQEGSTANVLNALQESLVAKHVQHKNVVSFSNHSCWSLAALPTHVAPCMLHHLVPSIFRSLL